MLLMLDVIWLGFEVGGILLFVIFIIFLLPLLGLLLIMMMAVVLRRTLLFGLLDLYPRGPRFFMLFVTLLFLPGPVGIWDGDWVSFGVSGITAEDVRVWPYSVSLLVKVSAFLGTLHWPAGPVEFGVGCVSFVELLILYQQWAGERLLLEAAVPKSRRVGRPISVSAVPFGPGIDIWRSCRFLVRALRMLPGGLGRFLPGSIGANHGRLRHIGWEKCCHGLTSRPRETSSVWFLDELLVLFGYPAASGADPAS